MVGTPVWLNDNYAHEQLKTDSHRLPDSINHQSVSVIAQLAAPAYSHQFPGEMACLNQQKTAKGPETGCPNHLDKLPVHLP